MILHVRMTVSRREPTTAGRKPDLPDYHIGAHSLTDIANVNAYSQSLNGPKPAYLLGFQWNSWTVRSPDRRH